MMRAGTLLLIFTILISLTAHLALQQNLHHNLTDRNRPAKQDRIDIAMAQEYLMTCDPKTKTVPKERLLRLNNLDAMKSASTSDKMWVEYGPNNIGGRTRAVLFDRRDTSGNTVFAGSVSGGLWRSQNFLDSLSAVHWENLSLAFENLAISALAQHPEHPEVIYVGTGEGFFGDNGVKGLGIWKSSDGGDSWEHLSSTLSDEFDFIQDIAVDPGGRVYVGTLQGGLMVSDDHGLSWFQSFGKDTGGESNQISDIEIIGNRLWIASGVNEEDAIYISNDGAITWDKIEHHNLPSTGYERIELASAPSNQDKIWAIYQDAQKNDVLGLYHSRDGGLTWQEQSLPKAAGMSNFARQQAWYNLSIAVDPRDEDHIWLGGIDLHRSTNGGASWRQVSRWDDPSHMDYVHADQHVIHFHPAIDNLVAFGNDGGIWASAEAKNFNPDIISKNNGYNVTQLYDVAYHPDTTAMEILASAQDNGSLSMSGLGILNATDLTGGDGTRCYIDQQNPDIRILNVTHNNYLVSSDGGETFVKRYFGNSGQFINAADYDSKNQVLYSAYHDGLIFRWNNPASGGYSFDLLMTLDIKEKIHAITIDNSRDDTWMYFATESGAVYRVKSLTDGSLLIPERIKTGNGQYVSKIAIDPYDKEHIVITSSNYGVVSIEESNNAGQSWSNIEGNLPDMPVRDAVFDENQKGHIYIATEMGVWETFDSGSGRWTFIGNCPKVRVDRLAHRGSDDKLFVATHGRGIFSYQNAMPEDEEPWTFSIAQHDWTVKESSAFMSNHQCIKRSDRLSIPISIDQAPKEDQLIQVSILGGTSATNGDDFQILQETIKVRPDGSQVQLTLEIFDDYIVENQEYIKLELRSDHQSESIQISLVDNDILPYLASSAETEVSLGSHDRQSDYAPFRGFYEDARSQIILSHEELSSAGIIAGDITSLQMEIVQKDSDHDFAYENFTISMGHTSLSSFTHSDQEFVSGLSAVFQDDIRTDVGFIDIILTERFAYNGEDNLVIQFCFDNEQWNNDDYVSMTDTDDVSMLVSYADNTAGCDLSRVRKTFRFRPKLRLTQSAGSESTMSIASEIQSMSSPIGQNSTTVFVNKDNELLAAADQLKSFDISCLDVAITESGTGFASDDWLPSHLLRSAKVYHVDADRLGFDLSIFYSDSEISEFNAGSHYVAFSPQADLSSTKVNYEIIPVDEYRITTNISAGFGVKLQPKQSGSYFLLKNINKSQASEVELTSFDVKRLGLDSDEISYAFNDMDTQVNSITVQYSENFEAFKAIDYDMRSLHDNDQITRTTEYKRANTSGEDRQYRLAFDLADGTRWYSDIKYMDDNESLFTLRLFPNPTTSFINFVITSNVSISDIKLYSIQGQSIAFELPDGNRKQGAIDLTNLESGIYIFKVIRSDGEVAIGKFSKEK